MPKIFQNEYGHNYETYRFGYCTYAARIDGDTLDDIYRNGFLPYSGYENVGNYSQLFYMARSGRINKKFWGITSENKRINKKFSLDQFQVRTLSGNECVDNQIMIDFCLNYFKNRHGERVMTLERLKKVLLFSPEVCVTEYSSEGIPNAYVIEILGDKIRHYWFSCFRTDKSFHSFGMWLIQSHVAYAFSENILEYYIGTLYGISSLYKTNIQGLEYWTGSVWLNDISKLKELMRS